VLETIRAVKSAVKCRHQDGSSRGVTGGLALASRRSAGRWRPPVHTGYYGRRPEVLGPSRTAVRYLRS